MKKGSWKEEGVERRPVADMGDSGEEPGQS